MLKSLLIAAFSGVVLSIVPATATPLSSALGLGQNAQPVDFVVEVQGNSKKGNKKGGGPGAGNPGSGQRVGQGGGGGNRSGNRGGGNRGRNIGTAVGVGVGLGVLGVIAVDAAQRSNEAAIERCFELFPDYDPETRTGYDRRGRAHRCP
jgi:hypothetical protein